MYILRIYKVYHKDIIIQKGMEQTHFAGLAQRLFIVQQPYNRASALHLPESVPYFPGIYLF